MDKEWKFFRRLDLVLEFIEILLIDLKAYASFKNIQGILKNLTLSG